MTGPWALLRALVDPGRREGVDERVRRAFLTSLWGGALRGVSLLNGLIAIPLSLTYLGVDRYGVWMTILSFGALTAFVDLGIGNVVVSEVAAADGKNDAASINRTAASGILALLAIAAALVIGFAVSLAFVDWGGVLRAGSFGREATLALTVFAFTVAASLPLTLGAKVQSGLQEGYRAHGWQLIGTLVGVAVLVGGCLMRLPVPWLVFAVVTVPLAGAAWSFVDIFGARRGRPGLRLSLSEASLSRALELVKSGALFLVLQISFNLAFTSDSLILAREKGPASVAEYSVAARLFLIAAVIPQLLVAGLWPAYAEAHARGDHPWIRRTLGRSLVGSIGISAALSLVVLLLARPVTKLLSSSVLTLDASLLLPFALLSVGMAYNSALSMYLNGTGRLRAQTVCAVAVAAAALTAKLLLVERFGATGMLWGTIAAYALLSAIPLSILTYLGLRKAAS